MTPAALARAASGHLVVAGGGSTTLAPARVGLFAVLLSLEISHNGIGAGSQPYEVEDASAVTLSRTVLLAGSGDHVRGNGTGILVRNPSSGDALIFSNPSGLGVSFRVNWIFSYVDE